MTEERKSHSLGVVSDTGTPPLLREAAERRRVPRVSLSSEQFRHAATGKIFPVADLSTTGMAIRILDPSDLILFPVGMVFQGNLNLRRHKHEVKARVRRITRESIGCEFEGLAPESQSALREFLDPALLGKELRPMPAPQPGMLWYQGPSGTHLFLWRSLDGTFHRLMLSFLGTFVQWEQDQGLTSGRAATGPDSPEVRGVIRMETLLLDPDLRPDPGKLSIAKTLILSSNLPEDLKGWCSRQLRADFAN